MSESEINIPAKRPLEPLPRAIVVGASSGIGAALTKELVRQGYVVAALARRGEELEKLCAAVNAAASGGACAKPYVHDVTKFDEIPVLFQQIVQELSGLDLIIYNAGVMPAVEMNEFDFAKDKLQVEVNLLGAMGWLNCAAERFQQAGSGHIVGISSVAGDRGRVRNPAYNTSKAGLTTYLEALRNRLTRLGVTVTTIKPGFVDTIMLADAKTTFGVISPDDAAERIVSDIKNGKQTVYIPRFWALIMLIIRNIPSFIFRRLSI